MSTTTRVMVAAGLALGMASLASADVLHDNGGIVTHPGQGFGGADASQLPAGANMIGENMNLNALVRVADDFTVPAGETWTVDRFTTFGYQTSAAGFTFTDLVVRIWDGDPQDPNSQVIVGDIETNRLNTGASGFSNIYRVTTTTGLLDTQRAVQRLVADLPPTTLTEGTYWVEWSTRGSAASGPFIPPVTELNNIPMGNAIIWRNAPWKPVADATWMGGGFPMDLPFIIEGTRGGGGGCYANCDGSTSTPFLNVNDFICFQSAFAAGDSYANCDGSTTQPVLNVNDFICFQSAFAAGCSAP